MNSEDLNRALAESFEPKPQPPTGLKCRPLREKCWRLVAGEWQPRNFTDPDLQLMMLKYLNRSGHRQLLLIALSSDIQDSQMERHLSVACALARKVWKEQS